MVLTIGKLSPQVVHGAIIRMIVTLILIQGWYSRQLDFVLAYPQADFQLEFYMKLPWASICLGTRIT